MTLQELRYLVALADQGRFVRAAATCNVGQPTLSTQLKKLEDYLGVTLFERNKHHLLPTPIGVEIVERARTVLDVVEQIRELARHGNDPMNGNLHLGVIPTLGPYLVPNLLPTIRESCPRLHLFLREDLAANLLEQLRKGRLDAILIALPIQGEDIDVMSLFREPFTVALPSGHPLIRKKFITVQDLAGQTVLFLEEGHCMRDQALAICGSAVSSQREEFKATSLEMLRQMVAAGVGCTLLPALAVKQGVGSVQDGEVHIRPFGPPSPTRTIGIAWRRRYPLYQTVKRLSEVILANLPVSVEAAPRQAKAA